VKWWLYEVSLETSVDVVKVNCYVGSRATTRVEQSSECDPPPFNNVRLNTTFPAVSSCWPSCRLISSHPDPPPTPPLLLLRSAPSGLWWAHSVFPILPPPHPPPFFVSAPNCVWCPRLCPQSPPDVLPEIFFLSFEDVEDVVSCHMCFLEGFLFSFEFRWT